MLTINREYLEGAKYVKEYNKYIEGYRVRTDFIKLNSSYLNPLDIVIRLCDSIIGYTTYNNTTNNHIALHKVWFDVLGINAEELLNNLPDKYNWWEPVSNYYIIYDNKDELKGINKDRNVDLFSEFQCHHITNNSKEVIYLPASVHNLFHGLYGKTRFSKEQLFKLLIDIKDNIYNNYISEEDKNFCIQILKYL